MRNRSVLFDARHESAFRLFNGFTEGCPDLTMDVYGRTLVINNYAKNPAQVEILVQGALKHLSTVLAWLRAGILKNRHGQTQAEKKGSVCFGTTLDAEIKEHGLWYALNLLMNRDASFYLDTRNLRKWLIENMRGKSVLNTFAHTGSLGVAALAGGASQVLQMDRNRRFLGLAKRSYALNGLPVDEKRFIVQDFFPAVARLKRSRLSFDCVILDPPFFSATTSGRVDQQYEGARLINKVRPLVREGGSLVTINNALYVSGAEYMQTLEQLCRDGYLQIAELIPVPGDCTGYLRMGLPITDPAPFNHSTKIAILNVRRK